MKVLMLNGSPHADGNTYAALHEMEQTFAAAGIETELLQIGAKDIRGCIACYSCSKNKKCVFDDLVNVVAARRGGLSAAFDELNKFFTISGMPVASSQYWNSVHGRMPGEAKDDAEGLQTMRTLARNMTFLMKSIALGREQFGLPEKEAPVRTNFIRG